MQTLAWTTPRKNHNRFCWIIAQRTLLNFSSQNFKSNLAYDMRSLNSKFYFTRLFFSTSKESGMMYNLPNCILTCINQFLKYFIFLTSSLKPSLSGDLQRVLIMEGTREGMAGVWQLKKRHSTYLNKHISKNINKQTKHRNTFIQ